MKFTATIDSEEFTRAMSAIPNIAKDNIRTALYKSAKAIEIQAVNMDRFKSKSGKLDNSIKSRMSPDNEFESEVYFDEGIATYGKYQEYGTGLYGPSKARYPIKPKNKPLLYYVSSKLGHLVGSKGVLHPGVKAKQFVTDAAKIKEPNFLKNISDAINNTIAAVGLK